MRKYIELMIWAMLIIFNAACVDDKIEGLPAPSGDDDSYLNYEPIPLSKLKIEGRYLVNEEGEKVNLHGFTQNYDPYFQDYAFNNYDVDGCLRYSKRMIDKLLKAGWKVDCMRLHMDPYWFKEPGCTGDVFDCYNEELLKKYIDLVYIPMAEYAISRGIYVVLLGPIGCREQIEVGEPYNEHLIHVWGDLISNHPKIKNNPYIMFELANEPITIKGADTGEYGVDKPEHFKALKQFFQPVVDAIRANTDNIIWVPGLGYEQHFDYFSQYPIEGVNIGYAAHLYPGWMGSDGINGDGGSGSGGYQNFQKGWDKQVKPVADFAPIIITEMDWAPEKYNASWGKAYTGTAGGAGFGANFKYIMDNTGNVSWLVFTGVSRLAQFEDIPGEPGAYTFLNDPEACPWQCFHWFEEYASAKDAPTVAPTKIVLEGIDNKTEIEMSTGSNKYVIVKAIFEDGHSEYVTMREECQFISSNPTAVGCPNKGEIRALADGDAVITVRYTPANGAPLEASINVRSTKFSYSEFNPAIWDKGTFDVATHTFTPALYGQGGWEYSSGLDLSAYKYLAVEILTENTWVEFKVSDQAGHEVTYRFQTDGKLLINLRQMQDASGNKVDPEKIAKVIFWTGDTKPITIQKIEPTNEGPKLFGLDDGTLNPSIWDTGTYDPDTHTLITGQWGFAGWEYPAGVDLSDYKYLVAELESVEDGAGPSFRIFDKGYWDGAAAEVNFDSSLRAVIDLDNLSKNGEKVEPTHIQIVGIWSTGNKKIVIRNVYLTDELE